MFDALYVNRRQLEAMFAFFDKDKNGSISRYAKNLASLGEVLVQHRSLNLCRDVFCRDEFRQGCENLNKMLPNEEKLSGIDHILDLIDFDHSNRIELNEFFEVRT